MAGLLAKTIEGGVVVEMCLSPHPLRHSALGNGRWDIELVLWRRVIVA
ncbi:hypothetical protein O998_01065 [Anaplasma phagocytophilum str. Norway variant1]|uniref:Uncharacterized protein n=1 Tax=Anaplasma phagocytophilum str. Norway variant1 TaxID=1392506 RepID=A0A7H9DZK3_ANAPH|nr:hypothetical protein [Anaplasma phagocytophilum]QLL66476.1 hypothetical protein O998_01065 [Anaplasma phagocytophilum str. Norway variant1]